MSEFIPITILCCLAIVGYLTTFKDRFASRVDRKTRARLGVIGGFTAGLLKIWLAFSLIRFLLLAPWLGTISFPSFLLAPVSLFYAESIVLLAFLGIECCQLNGYFGTEEWKRSYKDGVTRTTIFLVVTTAMFFVSWWALSPADYETFNGSFMSSMVGPAAVHSFGSSGVVTVTDMKGIAAIENAKAIPHATALSVLLAGIGFTCWMAILYLLKVLDEEYLQVSRKKKSGASVTFSKFEIRGGGPN